MPKLNRPPAYRLHKARKCAAVTIRGKTYYLGRYGSPESHEQYARLIAEWRLSASGTPSSTSPNRSADLTVTELMSSYWRFVTAHYVKDGRKSSEQAAIRAALRPLRELYGSTLAVDFGPLALKVVRANFIERRLSRGVINQNMGRIRRMFRWAVSEELLPASTHQALCAVQGLQRGRTTARETKPVPPVDDGTVDATIPHLPPIVQDMVRFQRLTGSRPGEVCILRPCDVDRSRETWVYRPESHKTQHHGHDRIVFIGPRAQQILLPYLLRDSQAYCFSPTESEHERHVVMRTNRRSKVQPSQFRRHKAKPKRPPRERYDRSGYTRAIRRAADKANRSAIDAAREAAVSRGEPLVLKDGERLVDRWAPNQLRHTAATEIRRKYGLEGAQVVLGHAKADVTQVYAERDQRLAATIMAEVG